MDNLISAVRRWFGLSSDSPPSGAGGESGVVDEVIRSEILAELLHSQQAWQWRKVQSHELRAGNYSVVRVSIDCVPQDFPELRYELEGGGAGQGAAFLVPVTYMDKGVLRQFDMRGPADEPLPVIGRSEYRALMLGVLLRQLESAILPLADLELLSDALIRLLDDDVETARAISEEILRDGTVNLDGVCPRFRFVDPALLQGFARELLTSLASVYVLFALLPAEYGYRRVVIKYSHHARQDPDHGPLLWRWCGAAGLVPLKVAFELSHPTGAASHHLEIAVPSELTCASLTMPGAGADRNTTDASEGGVAHAAKSYERSPAERAVVEFTVPWAGTRATTWLMATLTFAITLLGYTLPGAQEALLAAADGAGALLLAVPAIAVAFAAGRPESDVESVLLGPLRAVLIVCAIWLFACAASIVGVLHEPYRTWLWVAGAGFSGGASIALSARELRRWMGWWWWPLVLLIGTALLVVLAGEVRETGPPRELLQRLEDLAAWELPFG